MTNASLLEYILLKVIRSNVFLLYDIQQNDVQQNEIYQNSEIICYFNQGVECHSAKCYSTQSHAAEWHNAACRVSW